MDDSISKRTLKRLPTYLDYLRNRSFDTHYISAKAIASALGLGEIQVRKDLAMVSNKGKPKVGYLISELIEDLESFLGYNCLENAVLVGAGKLGRALLDYDGFKKYGLNIVAAFDKNCDNIADTSKPVLPMEKLDEICKNYNVRIGIITVPAKYAQEVCDRLIESGILAIWSFAPVYLKVPSDILVKNENMASSLAILSKHLSNRLN